MEIVELKAEMDRRFENVDKRFEGVDKRFDEVDKRFDGVDKRFNDVETALVQLTKQIADEGEKTRRHFDIAVEQMKAERNLVIDKCMAVEEQLTDLSAANRAAHNGLERRLDDHEHRIAGLERTQA